MISVLNHVIKPTIFPDGTVQVWKLSDELIGQIKEKIFGDALEIKWDYEHDGELIQVMQLRDLVQPLCACEVVLYCPFLPYGRQDKDISNDTCFGLHTFLNLVSIGFNELMTVDMHNMNCYGGFHCGLKIFNSTPYYEINNVIKERSIDVLLFPDKGASTRYPQLSAKDIVVADKIRNQATGEIVGIQIFEPYKLTGKNVLVVDDICDGGRTFIELSAAAKKYTPLTMSLWTTHGIYSKGKDCLYQAGYKTLHNFFELRK
jgi:ribose-phosphate pyrophosphokinase